MNRLGLSHRVIVLTYFIRVANSLSRESQNEHKLCCNSDFLEKNFEIFNAWLKDMQC